MLSLPGGGWRFGRPYQSMMPHCPLELKERWRRANLDDRQNAEIFTTGQLFLFKARKLDYEANGKLGTEKEKLQRQASFLHQNGSSRLAKLEKELDRAELKMNIQKPKEVKNKTQSNSRKDTVESLSVKIKGEKDKNVDQRKTKTHRLETKTESNQKKSLNKAKLRPLPQLTPDANIGTEFQSETKNPSKKAKPIRKENRVKDSIRAKTSRRKECDGEHTANNNKVTEEDIKKNKSTECKKTKPRPLPQPPETSSGTNFQREVRNSYEKDCEKRNQNRNSGSVQPKLTKLNDCDRPSRRPPPPEIREDVKKAAELYDRAAALSDMIQYLIRESNLYVGKEARRTGEEAKQMKAIADGMMKRLGDVCLDAAEQRHAELKMAGRI